MESPAFRGSTFTTTALIHSLTPPGFVADRKDLSPQGKLKTHNGCVVREKDKITLLKPVYTSPVRRSSRVRRKGCAVIPRPKVKRRYSEPAAYPSVTARPPETISRVHPKSSTSTPIKRVSEKAVNGLSNSTLSNSTSTPPSQLTTSGSLTSPDRLTEADFFRSDGTPRRRLMVRLIETPEIRQKLAEVGLPPSSTAAKFGEASPKVQSRSNALSQDDSEILSVHPRRSDVETNNSECRPDLSEEDAEQCAPSLEAVSTRGSENHFTEDTIDSDIADLERISRHEQYSASTAASDHKCFHDAKTKVNEILSSSESSSETLDMELEGDFVDGLNRARNGSSLETESIDSSDELANLRDPADEVLCISPLPFETSGTNFSFSDAVRGDDLSFEDGQDNHFHLEHLTCSPFEEDELPDEIAKGAPEQPVSPEETSRNPTLESLSVDIGACSSVSSRRPAPVFTVDLGKKNQLLSPVASPTIEMQQKCNQVKCLSPVNGMRPRQVQLFMPLPSETSSASGKGTDAEPLDSQDPLLEDVYIVNITPNRRIYNNLKGKQPSPTYASQANSDSPCSPRNTTCEGKHDNSVHITTSPSSALSPRKDNPSLCSPREDMSSEVCRQPDDDFQDFSEFDFLMNDGSVPCPSLPHAISPVVVVQNLSESSPVTVPASSPNNENKHDGALSELDLNQSSSKDYRVHLANAAENANQVVKEKQTHVNWTEMLESDAAHREMSSVQSSVAISDSDEHWTSASDFLTNECQESSWRKKNDKVLSRRSSMRIAKRMSLLSLEAETKLSKENDSGTTMQSSISGTQSLEPPNTDTKILPTKTTSSAQGKNAVSKGRSKPRKRRHSSQVSSAAPQVLNSPSSDLDKHVRNSSVIPPEPVDETLKVNSERPSSSILTMPAFEEKPPSQFDTDSSVSEDIHAHASETKVKVAKRLSKQSRRRSARLNPVLPSLKASSESPSAVTSDSMGSSEQSDTGSDINDIRQPYSNSSCFEEELKCHFDIDFEDNSDIRPEASTRLHKQSRRRSGRLNPVVLPSTSNSTIAASSDSVGSSELSDTGSELSYSSWAPSNSSCSESVSTEENFQCQFNNDPLDNTATKPKATKRHSRQSRRRSARLNPVILPAAAESPITATSDITDIRNQLVIESNIDDAGQFRSNSTSSASTFSSETGFASDSFDPDFDSLDSAPVTQSFDIDVGFVSVSESINIAPYRKQKKRENSRCTRRRSARLLKLSLTNLEDDEPTSCKEFLHVDGSLENIQKDPSNLDSRNTVSHLSSDFEELGGTQAETHQSEIESNNRDRFHAGDGSDMSASKMAVLPLEETHSCPDDGLGDVSVPTNSGVSGSLNNTDTGSGNQSEETVSHRRPRRKSSVVNYSEGSTEVKPKRGRRKSEEEAVKELYLKRGESKALKPNNLETIFEEVRFGKTGSPLYIGSRKCKRVVTFPEHPWLPRKKRKTAKDKPSQRKGRKKPTKDPSIDKKLEALLADLALMSPSSSETPNRQHVEDAVLPCRGIEEHHATTSASDMGSNTPTRSLPSVTDNAQPVSHTTRNEVTDSHRTKRQARKTAEQECGVGSKRVDTEPNKLKRDTPFKGSEGPSSYGAWLRKYRKMNNAAIQEHRCMNETHQESVGERDWAVE